MTNRVVVSMKHQAVPLPMTTTIVVGLLLDRLGAPEWLWGVMGVIFVLWWISAIVGLFNMEQRTPVWDTKEVP